MVQIAADRGWRSTLRPTKPPAVGKGQDYRHDEPIEVPEKIPIGPKQNSVEETTEYLDQNMICLMIYHWLCLIGCTSTEAVGQLPLPKIQYMREAY